LTKTESGPSDYALVHLSLSSRQKTTPKREMTHWLDQTLYNDGDWWSWTDGMSEKGTAWWH